MKTTKKDECSYSFSNAIRTLAMAAEAGFEVATKAFFGLLVAVWYVLNELLSIIENAGRMGAPVPEWLMKYVSVLKNKIDSQGDGTEERIQ